MAVRVGRAYWRSDECENRPLVAPSVLMSPRVFRLCTFASITLGLVCGQAGAIAMAPVGPLVPFLIGSCAGYSFGLFSYWKSSVNWCDRVAQRYPTLLIHALRTNPHAVEVPPLDASEGKLETWIKQGSLGRLSLCVLAAQACRNDVEEIERNERQRLMDEYQAQTEDDEDS